MSMFDHSEEPKNLQIDEQAKYYLLETGRWGKFLGITAIVLMVLGTFVMLFTIMAVSAASAMSTYDNGAATISTTFSAVIMIIALLLYIYPVYALMKFAGSIKKRFAV